MAALRRRAVLLHRPRGHLWETMRGLILVLTSICWTAYHTCLTCPPCLTCIDLLEKSCWRQRLGFGRDRRSASNGFRFGV